jgi:hypothetical protein
MYFIVSQLRPDGHSEKLLLAAVIRRAAYDIALYRGSTRLRDRMIWDDAHKWMYRSNPEHFGSFANICYLLDQNPQEIRRKTMRLTKQDVRKYDMVETNAGVQ